MDELQADIDKLRIGGKLSDNEIFQGYISDMKFALPKELPHVRSLIVLAVSSELMLVDFHLNGKIHEVMLPPGYYSTGLTKDILERIVQENIIKNSGYKIERTTELHLKLLAARSGLGRYGRNNLIYIDGMGSLLRLFAYFTDCQLPDDWTEIMMLDLCKSCRVCINHCPNKCISEDSFVINVGRCVTLFNEVDGAFPEWISPEVHNALIGCMRCQLDCPANRENIKQPGRLEAITEQETQHILNGTVDDSLLASLSKKLRNFVPASSTENFPIFTRNLKALLNARSGKID